MIATEELKPIWKWVIVGTGVISALALAWFVGLIWVLFNFT